jgi:hypothetical protein
VYGQCLGCSFTAGHSKLCEAFRRPAGNGHFGPNHIDWLVLARRPLRGGAEDRGAAGDGLAAKRSVVTGTSHAGIEVDLLKPRA